MNRKMLIIAALDCVKAEIRNAEECIEREESMNTLVYLTRASNAIMSCVQHLFIFDKNKL